MNTKMELIAKKNRWLLIPVGIEFFYLIFIGNELIQKRVVFATVYFQFSCVLVAIHLIVQFFFPQKKVNIAMASLFFIVSFILLSYSLHTFSNCYGLRYFDPMFQNISIQAFFNILKYTQKLFFITILVFFSTGFLIMLFETKTMKKYRELCVFIGFEIIYLLSLMIKHYFFSLYQRDGEVSNMLSFIEFPLMQFILLHLFSFAWFNRKVLHIIFVVIVILALIGLLFLSLIH